MKGAIVGSYRILDTISVGGMGTVYRAEHTLIGRLAAIKILHPELCANRDMVKRFFKEAKTTTSIKHPGIVEVFDFGYMKSGHAYLIMEFLEGMPLSHRVRTRGPIPEGEAAALLRGVCIALSAAHDKGVVHRDLKPDNIFVMPDPDSALGERVKILDFGIAKLTNIGLAGSATKTGSMMGTPTYMSPEQCRGTGDVDFRADLYSIGCIFYELVVGSPPFVRTGAGEVIGSHLFLDPEPPSRHVAGLSPETEALIMKLLAKRPELRVQSARELTQLLAVIAQRHGWMALGEISRPSLNRVAVTLPEPNGNGPPGFTPVTTPTTLVPTTVTPSPEAPPLPTPAPTETTTLKPTTLTGAASEIRESPRRSRRGLGIAIASALVAAGGGFGAVIALSDSSETYATQPSAAAHAVTGPGAPDTPAPGAGTESRAAGAEPTPAPARQPTTEPTPSASPTAAPAITAPQTAARVITAPPAITAPPTAAPAITAQPTDVPAIAGPRQRLAPMPESAAASAQSPAARPTASKRPAIQPAAAKAVAVRPTAANPSAAQPTAGQPAPVAPPSPALAPAPAGPAAITPPAVKPAAKPTKKPARKPDDAGSASEDKDLLEQDI